MADFGTEGSYGYVVDETMASSLQAACVACHRFDGEAKEAWEAASGQVVYTATADVSGPVSFTKYSIYTDTLRHGDGLVKQGIALHEQLAAMSFDDLLAEQAHYMENFWKSADIVIEKDDKLQEGIRFNLYQLLQSAGRDRHSNISAKGLSGEGYEGHYFWDTEIYMFPIFLMNQPQIAKQLLLYRYSILIRRERERGRWGIAGRAVPVAHDRRDGMLLLLPGRHRAVPYQRRYRL